MNAKCDIKDIKELSLVQTIDVNVREPEKVITCLSRMAKVSFDVNFVKLFLEGGVVPFGGKIRVSFYNTGKYRTDEEIKSLFDRGIAFDSSKFVSVLFSLLNYQISSSDSQKFLSNTGRAVCFVVLDKEKIYTVTVSFKPFPLLEWRVRVYEENEYRWKTNDWLVVPD